PASGARAPLTSRMAASSDSAMYAATAIPASLRILLLIVRKDTHKTTTLLQRFFPWHGERSEVSALTSASERGYDALVCSRRRAKSALSATTASSRNLGAAAWAWSTQPT